MIHSIPRRHELRRNCWCEPVLVDGVWFHQWSQRYDFEDVDVPDATPDDAASQQKES